MVGEDIIKRCMRNVETVTEEEERRKAQKIIGDAYDAHEHLLDKDMVRESESMQDSLSSRASSVLDNRDRCPSDGKSANASTL